MLQAYNFIGHETMRRISQRILFTIDGNVQLQENVQFKIRQKMVVEGSSAPPYFCHHFFMEENVVKKIFT